MPRFSVIVPLTDDSYLFDNSLASTLRTCDDDTRVIVAHDGKYKDPYSLKSEVEFVSAGRDTGLAGLINCGLRATEDEIVAVIRPGVELPDQWQTTIQPVFENDSIASVSPLIVNAGEPRKMVTAGVTTGRGCNRRLLGQDERIANRTLKRIKPLGPTSWAAFYRRNALAEFGSLDEQLDDHYLDLDLALGLKALGYKCVLQHHCRASIDRAFPILREATLPHGMSAGRALRRHRTDGSLGDSVLSFAGDLVLGIARPWMFSHAMQRMSAGKLKDIDSLFSRRIERIIDRRKLETLSEGVLPTVAGQIKPGTRTSRRGRRAA